MAFYEEKEVQQLVDLLCGKWKMQDVVDTKDIQGLLRDVGFFNSPQDMIITSSFKLEEEPVKKQDNDSSIFDEPWQFEDETIHDDNEEDDALEVDRKRKTNYELETWPEPKKAKVSSEVCPQDEELLHQFGLESGPQPRILLEKVEVGDFKKPRRRTKQRKEMPKRKKDKSFSCSICSEVEPDGQHLLSHFKEHHRADQFIKHEDLFKCPVDSCSYVHDDLDKMENHIRWHHSQVLCPFCATLVPVSSDKCLIDASHFQDCLSLPNQQICPFLCYLCRQPFWYHKDIKHHINMNHAEKITDFLPCLRGKPNHIVCPLKDCDFVIDADSDGDAMYNMCNHHSELHWQAMCPYCLRRFGLEDTAVRLHVSRCHGVYVHRCTRCTDIFSTREKYVAHRRLLHKPKNVEGTVVCERCGGDYASASLPTHLSTCKGNMRRQLSLIKEEGFTPKMHPLIVPPDTKADGCGKYICPICGDQFERVDAHNLHLNRMHNNQECPDCGKTFAFDCIVDHVAVEHGKVVFTQRGYNVRSKRAVGRCEVCEKAVYTTWEVHKKQGCKVPYRNLVPYRNPKVKLVLEMLPDAKLGRYCCIEEGCGVTTKMRCDILRHFCEEHNPQKCPDCGKVFPYRQVVRHMAINHTGVTRHACETCGERFYDRVHLRDHEESVHEKQEKKWICQICGKSFAVKTKYMNHVNEHNRSQTVFPCMDCNKRFRSRIRLVDHRTREHPAFGISVAGT